jgi:hypothetical protein
MEETDIFDYRKDSVTKKFEKVQPESVKSPSAIIVKVDGVQTDNVQLPQVGSTTRHSSNINPTLIPDASVIDASYKKKLNVEIEQSIVSFWMDKTRENFKKAEPKSDKANNTNQAPPTTIPEQSRDSDPELDSNNVRLSIWSAPSSRNSSKND